MMKLKKGSKINLIGTALILVFAVVGLIGFLLLVVSTTAEVEQTFQEPVSYVQPALQNQLSVSFYSLPDEQVPTGILLSAFGADLRPVVLFPVGHKPAIDLGYTICDNDTKVKPLVIFSDGQRTYFYFGVSQLPDQSNRQMPKAYRVSEGMDVAVSSEIQGGWLAADAISERWTLYTPEGQYVCVRASAVS